MGARLQASDEGRGGRRARTWWSLLFCLLLVCAGGASASVTEAEAQSANAAPVARDSEHRVKKGGTLRIPSPGVLRNDVDPDGDQLTAARVSSPKHGRLVLRGGGSFVYTPDGGFRGKDSFIYRATDPMGATDTATVEITVWSPDRLPLARNNAYGVEEDATLTVPAPGVLRNDAEADGRRLFASKVTDPGHGDLSLARDGSFVYTPDADFDGEDSFVYRARDNRGRNDEGTVRIAVGGVNDAPVFSGAAGNTAQTIDEGAELAALEATDADGDPLTFELTGGSLPPGITLGDDGRFSGAAGGRAAGNYAASIRVSDGDGATATTDLAVTVNAVEEATVAEDADVATDEDVAKTITLTATDPDTDNLTFAFGTPGHGSLGTPSAPDCATAAGTATCTTTVLYTPDADYNGPDSFTYTAGDSGPGTVRITVNAVNDEPEARADNKTTPENTPLVFPASDLVANDSEGAANENTQNLSVGGVSDPVNGTVSLDNDEITFTPQADYNGPASFEYTVCDDGNPQQCSTQTAKVDVTVSPVNSAPVAQNDALTMDEDAGPTQIDLGPLVSDVETSDANLDYTIITGPTPQQGNLSGDGPTFAFDPAADFAGVVEISYKVADRGDPDGCGTPGAGCDAAKESGTRTVTVTVNPVNDPPANISLSNSSVDENEPSGTLVGTLSSTDPDAGDAHSYALVAGAGSDDNGQFTISGDELRTAAPFDRETKSSYAVRVKTTDGTNATFEEQLTITVDNVNEAPTDITLSDSSVDENKPSGTPVGTLATTDPDNGDVFTYALAPGDGSDDNDQFQVSGDELQTAARFDHETKSDYTVRVRSTDGGNFTTEKVFAITVTDANDAPTANDDSGTTDEDTILNVSAPGVLANDADEDAGDTRTVGKLNGSTTLTGTSAKGATVTINADGSYTYDPGSIFQQLLTGQDDTDTFTYNAKDAGGLESGPATVTITIAGITEPPRITSGGTLDYTENDQPTPVHDALDVTHPDGGQISEATVEITGNYQNGEDFLAFSDNDAGDDIALAPGSTADTLTLTGADSAANYQAALRAVTYENTSEDPLDLTRTVTFTATDANSAPSAPATREISVAPVDDPPVAQNNSATVEEDAAATAIPVLDNDTDIDGGPKTISSTSDPANGTVVLTGGSPGARTGLTYQPDANYCNDPPATNTDTFTYTLNGGSSATVSMTVTCVNDAPAADDETFDGADGAIGNTTLIGDDPSDGAPNPNGPRKTISGDILAGDTDIDGPGPLTVTPGTFATNDGGSVTLEADGDFTFHPAASTSCTDTSDFFDYTVEDSGSPEQTDTGRVTIAIAGCVWYVSNNAAGNSGTSNAPFDTISQAETSSGSGNTVFVFDGDNTSTGYGGNGYATNAGERLIGEHEGLVVDPDGAGSLGSETLQPANAGAHPTLTATNADVIDLDDSNEVRGFNIDPQGTGGGIAGGTGDTGGGTIDDVNVVDNGTAGTQPALELDSTTGAFNVSDLVVNNKAIGVRLHNTTTNTNTVNAVFSPASQISITSDGGPGLDVDGTAAKLVDLGTSTFDDITVTNSGSGGLNITNATGTINLGDGDTPDLSLTTTSGATPAFELNNAGNVTVAGAGTDSVSATGGPTINVSNMSGTTLDFDTMSSNGSSTDGVRLDNTSGTVTGSAGTIQNAGDQDVDISGNNSGDTVDFTYNGSITDDVGTLVNVSGQNGGTKDFNGAITDGNDGDGSGISLTNNTGATVRFDGGLTLSTGSNAAFSATGNGTVVVTDPVGLTDNTIATTTGTALNVANTTIGASGLTFRSISANGAANGIVLNNTGTSGGLTVTGTGSTANSGGTIQNTTGDAISIASSGGHTFDLMRLNNLPGGGFFVRELTGNNTISRTTIENFNVSGQTAIDLNNSTANNAHLTLDANLIQHQTNTNGMTAVSANLHGGVNFDLDVIDSNTADAYESKFTDLFGSAMVIGPGENGSVYPANMDLTVSNTKFVDAFLNVTACNDGDPNTVCTGGINNLEMTVQGNSTINFNITNNLFDNVSRGNASAIVGIINFNATNSGRISGNPSVISGNTIQNIGASTNIAEAGYLGIRIAPDNSSAVSHNLLIQNNTIKDIIRQGILVSARDRAVLNAKLEGNTVGTLAEPVAQSNRRGIEFETQASGVINTAVINNPSIVGAGTSNSNSSLHLRSGVTDPANGTINATVTGNTISNTNAGNTTGRFRAETVSVGAGAGNMCLDLRNNILEDASKEFNLQHNSAVPGVFNLNQSGNAGTITNTGARALGTVASCSQPGF